MAAKGWNPTSMPSPETRFTPHIPDLSEMIRESAKPGELQTEGDAEV